jgi:2-isopropylmalate synthase
MMHFSMQMTTEKLIIFDTTLRDGEQSAGAAMHKDEKLRIAELLEELGVDIIEAGFPASSDGDFEAVSQIAKRCQNTVIAGLARAKKFDIERCWDAVRHAARPRIHTFLSTSPLHRKYKLQMDETQVLDAIRESVTLARNLCDNIEWSAEDATRTETDFLLKCIDVAIRAGATTINIPDTVGYALPDEYAALFRTIKNQVPDIDRVILSTHCQNDLGLATANSLAGLAGGARQVECTINGIGERAGNAALEEVVMAVKTRPDLLPLDVTIKTELLSRISKLVANVAGMPVQPNKAIVGANAFAHESGIHQDGYLKHAGTYEIMTPESVGLQRAQLPLGKLSGRNAFKTKLESLGYKLGDNALNDAFVRFKTLADRKREIFDDDVVALVDDTVASAQDGLQFVSMRVVAGNRGPQQAELAINVGGTEKQITAQGNGPVDAIFNAIQAMVPHPKAVLQLYQIHAVTEGTDAQGTVTVRLAEGDHSFNGHAADTDVLVASAKAYLQALSRLLAWRERTQLVA